MRAGCLPSKSTALAARPAVYHTAVANGAAELAGVLVSRETIDTVKKGVSGPSTPSKRAAAVGRKMEDLFYLED